MNIINRIVENFTDLYKNKKREFTFLATKTAFLFLYWFGITLPLFRGNSRNGNVLQIILGGTWIFLIFLLAFLVYPILELAKIKFTKKIFKIITILMIISSAWIILTYVIVVNDIAGLVPVFGFWLAMLSCAATGILNWKSDIIMNLVYKVFKVSEVEEVEYVEEAPEPEVEPTSEPEPKDVEEVKEEIEQEVEEETEIEEVEEETEELKEKE